MGKKSLGISFLFILNVPIETIPCCSSSRAKGILVKKLSNITLRHVLKNGEQSCNTTRLAWFFSGLLSTFPIKRYTYFNNPRYNYRFIVKRTNQNIYQNCRAWNFLHQQRTTSLFHTGRVFLSCTLGKHIYREKESSVRPPLYHTPVHMLQGYFAEHDQIRCVLGVVGLWIFVVLVPGF